MKKEHKKRIKYFTKRVYFWQRMLGFTDVDIRVGIQKRSCAQASWYSIVSGRILSIRCSMSWIKDPDTTKYALDKTSFHEVYESQLYVINNMLNGYYDEDYIAGEMHPMVRRAENHIFPRLRKLKLPTQKDKP